jgi:hypothetical protein
MAKGIIDGERAAVAERDGELYLVPKGYKVFMT